MSEIQNPGGGAPSGDGGAKTGDNAGAGNSGAGGAPQAEPKMVKQEDLERALRDVHRLKGEAAAAKAEADAAKADRLKSQNDYKSLYETEAEAHKGTKGKLEGLEKGIFTRERTKVLTEAAIKSGLRPEALPDLELLNPQGVVVEATTEGRILVHGAETFTERLKRERPHWFQDPKAPNINTGGGGTPPAPTDVTAEMVVAAEMASKKDPTKRPEYLKLVNAFNQSKNKKTS